MRYPFSASELKLKRARQHLTELQTELGAYIQSEPMKFILNPTEKNGKPDILLTIEITTLPSCIGAIIGDVIHNLRTALDLAACDAVRAAGGNDSDVYFPFCKTSDELEAMIKKRKIHRAGLAAVELIRDLKPHHNGNFALRAIHDLDIYDKHEAIIPGLFEFRSPTINNFDDDGAFSPTAVPGTGGFDFAFPPVIGMEGRRLIPTLHELVQLVDGIVIAFRALANRDEPTP